METHYCNQPVRAVGELIRGILLRRTVEKGLAELTRVDTPATYANGKINI